MQARKRNPPTLFNPKPSRPTLPKKPSPPTADTPSPGSSQSVATPPNPSQSTPGTPRKLPPPKTATPVRRPAAAPAVTSSSSGLPPPEGEAIEYKLMSSKLNGWKYDVMKFESRKAIEIGEWAMPVKLNRKDPHRNDAAASGAGAGGAPGAGPAVAPMVGSDGKHVIGADGRVVMVDAQGRPVRGDAAHGAGADAKEEKGKDKDKKRRFQKKTRQVFLVPEETRQLRREEKFPWVMEDGRGRETWVGKMEEVAKSQTYAMFMPAADHVFKFVPAHRWYKFQKKPSHHVPNLEEAESLMTKMQKRKDATHWTLRQKTEEAAASGSSLVYNAGQSFGPGGRKLRTVDSGSAGLFGDDDDEDGDVKRKIKRENGAEGDLDELDFEEGFADDEEKAEPDNDDEEEKELEERLKREYKTANKLREGYIDESDGEDDEKLTSAGKNLHKTLRKHEKGGYDDSDDERNPYASSDEEEEEEEPQQAHNGPAIQPPEPKPGARPAAVPAPGAPSTPGKPGANGQTPTGTVSVKSESRATSPVPPGHHGGHSVVAKRATSPKVPKPKAGAGIASRAGSPLASPNGASPPASRATSPSSTLPGPPAPLSHKSAKRKATDDGSGGASGSGDARPKKRKAGASGSGAGAGGAPAGELEDRMVVEWLRNTPNATTRECIQHFTRFLTDEPKKARFTALVKEVAQLSNGILVLRPAYRTAAASPTPAVAG